MAKNTSKHKANKLNLPSSANPKRNLETLPINEKFLNQSVTFSFIFLDHEHELFNLGGKSEDKTVGGKWFLDLMDCFKNVNGKTIQELKHKPFCLHPVNWQTANAKCPFSPEIEWWQFRINKSRGRVIGMLIDKVFYVVWLDAYHNLTTVDGYGGVTTFKKP